MPVYCPFHAPTCRDARPHFAQREIRAETPADLWRGGRIIRVRAGEVKLRYSGAHRAEEQPIAVRHTDTRAEGRQPVGACAVVDSEHDRSTTGNRGGTRKRASGAE